MPADPAEPDRGRAALRALLAAQLRQDAAELTELAGRRSTEYRGPMETLRRNRSLTRGLHGATAALEA